MSFRSLAAVPIIAIPVAIGEGTYVALQAVDFQIGAAELVRVASAIATTWMTVLTGLAWRTYQMSRADHQLLHGVKDAPGIAGRLADLHECVKGLPVDLERRFDGAVDRMVALGEKLESRIERLEDREMGDRDETHG